MKVRVVVALLLATCVASCGEDDATACDLHDDCNGSKESLEAGRCGPASACVAGACVAWCPTSCTVAVADINPCEDGYICSEPMTGAEPRSTCRATEIACDAADDCPKYLPGDGEWRCDDGICRFPGFTYLYPES